MQTLSLDDGEGGISREMRHVILAVGSAALVVFCAAVTVVGAYLVGVPPLDLLRDPSMHFHFPVYGGLISNLAVSIMTLAAAVAGFAAIFGRRLRRRMAAAAILSAVLAIDDQYMLHDKVGPDHLGIPEVAFYALYLTVALAIAWSIGRALFTLRHATLLIAGLGFAFSVALDLVLPLTAYTVLVEDLAKLGGMVVWLVYWTATAARAMDPGAAHRPGDEAG